jgi:putative FmdB family regulatory protein
MPIYEYQCAACGHQMEAFQKIAEEPLTTCPACQHSPLNKLVSAAGFQLKGTGWYATDYRDKAKPKASKSEETNPAGSDSGAETKSSETKGDASQANNSSSSSTAAKE